MQSHPLTENPWSVDSNPEHGLVPLLHLYNIDRDRYAIASIARLVGNSASEPDATGSQPLDAWTASSVIGPVTSSSSNCSALAGSAGLLDCFADFGLRAMVGLLENHHRPCTQKSGHSRRSSGRLMD